MVGICRVHREVKEAVSAPGKAMCTALDTPPLPNMLHTQPGPCAVCVRVEGGGAPGGMAGGGRMLCQNCCLLATWPPSQVAQGFGFSLTIHQPDGAELTAQQAMAAAAASGGAGGGAGAGDAAAPAVDGSGEGGAASFLEPLVVQLDTGPSATLLLGGQRAVAPAARVRGVGHSQGGGFSQGTCMHE